MEISIIVAIDKNRGIGYNNELLFWLPNDLKHFKALTTHNTIIMGRKTFESLPKGALPNRRNIVLSRNEELVCEGAEIFHSLDEAFEHCQENEHVFIIGGESIYRKGIEKADSLYITEINASANQIDAYFPELNQEEWNEESRENFSEDEKHSHSYSFVKYTRKNN